MWHKICDLLTHWITNGSKYLRCFRNEKNRLNNCFTESIDFLCLHVSKTQSRPCQCCNFYSRFSAGHDDDQSIRRRWWRGWEGPTPGSFRYVCPSSSPSPAPGEVTSLPSLPLQGRNDQHWLWQIKYNMVHTNPSPWLIITKLVEDAVHADRIEMRFHLLSFIALVDLC